MKNVMSDNIDFFVFMIALLLDFFHNLVFLPQLDSHLLGNDKIRYPRACPGSPSLVRVIKET